MGLTFHTNTNMPQPQSPEALEAKRLVYAMRNGVVADALRQGGSPFRLIMGVNLPQLAEIAERLPHTAALASELWADTASRESMLLAPMVMPAEDMTPLLAREWVAQIPATEVADVLCHKLLRREPWAARLAADLVESSRDMDRYTGLRLYFNIISGHAAIALEAAETELKRDCPLTAPIARSLSEEARYILEDKS